MAHDVGVQAFQQWIAPAKRRKHLRECGVAEGVSLVWPLAVGDDQVSVAASTLRLSSGSGHVVVCAFNQIMGIAPGCGPRSWPGAGPFWGRADRRVGGGSPRRDPASRCRLPGCPRARLYGSRAAGAGVRSARCARPCGDPGRGCRGWSGLITSRRRSYCSSVSARSRIEDPDLDLGLRARID